MFLGSLSGNRAQRSRTDLTFASPLRSAPSVHHFFDHFGYVSGDCGGGGQSWGLHANEVDGLGDGGVAGDYEIGVAFAARRYELAADYGVAELQVGLLHFRKERFCA